MSAFKKNTASMPLPLRVSYEHFTDGWNFDAAPDSLRDTELSEAMNCLPDERGGISKRPGTVRLNQVSYGGPIKRVYEVGKPDSIKFINASDNVLRNFDGTAIHTGFANVDFDVEVWGNKTYFVNGDKYYVWDYINFGEVVPAVNADLTAVKRCKYICQRGIRMFAAGDPQNPNRVYFSEGNEPNNFKATSSVDAVTDDEDVITGLFVVGTGISSALVVFKKRSIYAWSGWDPLVDVQFHKQSAGAGTVARRTICQANNSVYYMGEHGVYRLVSPYPDQILSECITDPTPQRPGISNFIRNLKNKENVCAVFWRRYYMLAVQDGDTPDCNNKVLVFDTALDRWVGWFNLCVNDWCIRSDGKLVFASSLGGLLLEYGVGWNDDGSPIHFKVSTKDLDLGHRYHDKKIKIFMVSGKQYVQEKSTVKITVKTDYSITKRGISFDESNVDSKSIIGGSIWGWKDTITKIIKDLRQRGMRTHITFENDVLGEPVTIYGISFGFRLKRAKVPKIVGVEVLE